MAIGMTGGIYCPLSPQDPQDRLDSLVQQTQGRLVTVDWWTKSKFYDNLATLEIDLILRTSDSNSDINVNQLSNVAATSEATVYVIFTSGSTGIPKAVSLLLFFNQLCFTFFTL